MEREGEYWFEFGAVAPVVAVGIDIDNGYDNGFVNCFGSCVFEYGFEYGLAVPYGAFFATVIFGLSDNIIAELTAITVAAIAVTRTEKENNGVTFHQIHKCWRRRKNSRMLLWFWFWWMIMRKRMSFILFYCPSTCCIDSCI